MPFGDTMLMPLGETVNTLPKTNKHKDVKSLPDKGLFHVKLSKAAERAGYDPDSLAQALGVRVPTVYRWFSGEREPGGVLTLRMVALFGLAPADLLTDLSPGGTVREPGPAPGYQTGAGGLPERVAVLEAAVRDLVRRLGPERHGDQQPSHDPRDDAGDIVARPMGMPDPAPARKASGD